MSLFNLIIKPTLIAKLLFFLLINLSEMPLLLEQPPQRNHTKYRYTMFYGDFFFFSLLFDRSACMVPLLYPRYCHLWFWCEAQNTADTDVVSFQ